MAIGNQTLGRGKLYFSRFKTGTYNPEGYRYVGNTPSFSLNIENETLDHFSSDEGVKEKDKSIVLQTTSTGALVCDDIQLENLALFFFGSSSTLSQSALTSQTETLTDVIPGMMYQLGVTDNNPSGIRSISNVSAGGPVPATGTITFSANPAADDTVTVNGTTFTAKASGATGNQFNIGADVTATALALKNVLNASVVSGVALATYTSALGVVTVTYDTVGTAGNSFTLTKVGTNIAVSGATLAGGSSTGAMTLTTDYTVDLDLGTITIVEGGHIDDGDEVVVTFDQAAKSRNQVISGSTQIEGALKFVADNPEGDNLDYLMPYVRLAPNGDYDLKGDDWLQLSLSVEILKAPSRERIYLDGRAY